MSTFMWMCQQCGGVGLHSEACISATSNERIADKTYQRGWTDGYAAGVAATAAPAALDVEDVERLPAIVLNAMNRYQVASPKVRAALAGHIAQYIVDALAATPAPAGLDVERLADAFTGLHVRTTGICTQSHLKDAQDWLLAESREGEEG